MSDHARAWNVSRSETLMDGWNLAIALCIGVGLAAAAGFRVFVPLLVLAIAGRAGHLDLASNLDWLTSNTAIVALSIATALEIGAYYIPWVDNALDTIATPAAGIAGTIAAASMLVDMDPMLQWALGIIAGGGAALSVQGLSVGARAVSSVTTGGLGNSAVATTETGAATALAVIAVVVPLLAAALVVIVLIGLARFVIRRRRSRRANESPQAPAAADADDRST